MSSLIIDYVERTSDVLPSFSVEIEKHTSTAIYSDVDIQIALMDFLSREKDIHVFDFEEALYERLTVQENIHFFRKWFQCSIPISELLVKFDLQQCAGISVSKCSPSEMQRIYYAKYYMSNAHWNVFYDPISSVNVQTMNVFIQLIERILEEKRSVLILVASAEHALLLTDIAYRLGTDGLHQLETESEEREAESATITSPVVEKLFKIPAKIDDKVILFDPTEIDYIESQSGKSYIYINKDAFALDLTLTEIEKKLELYGFYRCHRSYIVNLQKVREIITWSKNTYSLRINNKAQSTISLSRTKLHVIQEIFKLK